MEMEYASKTIILYGLAFFLSFYGMLIHKKISKSSEFINNLSGGLIMGLIQSALVLVVDWVGLIGMPDVRFLLLGYTAYLFGPWAGILSGAISLITVHLVNHTSIFSLMLIDVLDITIFCLVRRFIKSKKRRPKSYETIAFVFLSSVIVIFFAAFISRDIEPYVKSIHNFISLMILASLLMSALLNVSFREQERLEFIENLEKNSEELKKRNQEIETLYEDVSAKEKILQKNFDEFSSYQERIEFLAFHESQTGFFNREKLFERLRNFSAKTMEPLEVMLMIGIKDADKLEKTLGNVLSETLYYLVGIDIMSVFEEVSDGQVYSVGKGKFAILINQSHNKAEIVSVYDYLRERFINPVKINTVQMKVNIIAGAVTFNEEILEPEQWMEQCEFALYSADGQKTASSIIWFGNDLSEIRTRTLLLEKGLYSAVEKSELYLVYQPQYDNNEMLCGAEALLRWKNEEFGEISPMIFIPMAEKNGLIDNIGKMVLHHTCQFIQRNRELVHNQISTIPISINASFLELINPNFTQQFLAVLNQYGIGSEHIKLEVTESEVSVHYSELLVNLKALYEAGIGTELDDFGTGYSSLNHLGIMPVQTIKIDKVFIDRIIDDDKIGDIVEMIIDFSHRFKMKVVAEGVETKEQFLWLRKKKCDIYQGYYFSKPLKEEQFLAKISEFINNNT